MALKGLRFKGLKVTNEQQVDGTGTLHQVAQHPVDQVFLYTSRPCKTRRDKVLAAEQVGVYTPPNPSHLAQRGTSNVRVVNNYQSLSGVLDI